MRKAMLATQGEASSGVANGNSSAPQSAVMDVAPMEIMADDMPEGEEDMDEDAVMAEAEQKVGQMWLVCMSTHCVHTLLACWGLHNIGRQPLTMSTCKKYRYDCPVRCMIKLSQCGLCC